MFATIFPCTQSWNRYLPTPSLVLLALYHRSGNYLCITTGLQEIADGVIPLMFMKEFAGLDPAPAPCDVVSLARFTIMSYLFCAEQMPDAIFGFITMLKQKLTMTFEANLHTYSLDMLLKVMVEDLRPSAAGSILLLSIERLGKEAELSLTTVVKLSIKYPILFYVFERFRKHVRRIMFGDKFWKDRPQLKLRMEDVQGSSAYFNHRFRDEATAVLETSRSIISDVVSVKKRSNVYRLTDKQAPEVPYLEEVGLQKLKDIFGYEKSRQLAVDSQITMECESSFVEHAFGQDGPVQHPLRGVKVFPGGAPKGILDIPHQDSESDDEDRSGDDEQGEGVGEADGRDSGAPTEGFGEPQTEEEEEVENLPAAPHTPGGYMTSPPDTPYTPGRTPQLSPMVSSIMRMSTFISVPSFASFPLSWGTRPATAELVQEEPEPLPAHSGTHIETILDSQQGREFRFDPETGKSAWVRSVVDGDGDLLLEYCS